MAKRGRIVPQAPTETKAETSATSAAETTSETSAPTETTALALPSETLPPGATDFDPGSFEPSEIVNQVAEATRMPENGREPKQFTPAPDPFDIQSVFTDDNAVHLGNSHRQRAYFVHFDHKPAPGPNGEKHPALAALQDAGFKWREVGDGSFAWKKPWAGNQFSYVEEQDNRRLVNQVGALLGPVKHEERVPD
ncbi:hypothetical protein [Fimbriiglobus ruber]|uniref:hypothetical protein n=1 Tax=Fimbriiglobus ruber TaxID=1908690 RepID=UPI001179E31E|nr:hypothetical protein [Fimbriiglobus ruber]